jgi:hypothetical protein
MLGDALNAVAGYLDRRLVLTVLFPTLVFWSALVLLIGGHIGWHRMLTWWRGLAGEQQALILVAALAGAVFFASLVSVFIGSLTRLYEGYWGARGLGRTLAKAGIAVQRWRHRRLDPNNPRHYEIRYRQYPRLPEDLLPTRLGNVLKATELYPGDEGRYGMDAVFFWPRLYMVLPETMRDSLQNARSSLDLTLVTSALGWLYALTACCFLALAGASSWYLWLVAAAGVLAALAAYRGTVRAGVTYGELVRTAFDLYRGDLLAQLGYAAPTSLAQEQVLWRNLGKQMYRRRADDPSVLRYAAAGEQPAAQAGNNDWSLAVTIHRPSSTPDDLGTS